MKKLILLVFSLSLAAVVPTLLAAQEQNGFLIIVHPENPTESLSIDEVAAMLLKKETRWPDGDTEVQPVDQEPRSAIRKAMSKTIHGRAVFQIERYWQKQIFEGGKPKPPVLRSDQEVIDFVRSSRGAIGYVSSDQRPDGVKVLALSN